MAFWFCAALITLFASGSLLIANGWYASRYGLKNTGSTNVDESELKKYRVISDRISLRKNRDTRSFGGHKLNGIVRFVSGKNLSGSTRVQNFIFAVFILLLPIVSFGLYGLMGSPILKGHSFNELFAKNVDHLSSEEKLVRLTVLFMRNPTNGQLADQLATAELEAGRYQAAINTYIDSLKLNGENAQRLVGYGISLTQYESGVITKEAQAAFNQAAQLAPKDVYPRLFIAAAFAQDGKRREAADYLHAFLLSAPEEAPWRSQVERLIKHYRSAE